MFQDLKLSGLALVVHLDAPSNWRPGGHGFNPSWGRQHSFVEVDHEMFSTVILYLSLIQEGQLSVSGERMCTILVNRLEDWACPVNVRLGKLTALDMTPLGWLGCKTSTQTNKLGEQLFTVIQICSLKSQSETSVKHDSGRSMENSLTSHLSESEYLLHRYCFLTLKLPITTIVICFVICLWF